MQNKQFFPLAALVLILAGCGGGKQAARVRNHENKVDMTVAQAEGDAVSFFDQDISGFQDIETFVLDEENADVDALNQPTQLAWQEPTNNPDSQMESLYFEYDRPDLTKDQQARVSQVKSRVDEWIKRGDTVAFKGNCCRWGKNCNTRNFPLSNDRAYAAVDLCGIDRNNPQIKVFGVGSEEPVVFDESSKEAQAPNRRVDIYPLSL
jgi:outer membrane protein OmpA-like peptidoglycan-associated protein